MRLDLEKEAAFLSLAMARETGLDVEIVPAIEAVLKLHRSRRLRSELGRRRLRLVSEPCWG